MSYLDIKTCVSAEVLRGYVAGELPVEQAEKVFEHLDCCKQCETQLSSFAAHSGDTAGPLANVSSRLFGEKQLANLMRRAALISSSQRWKSPPALLGKQLNQYKLQKVLGRGGMGDVYLARHDGLRHRQFAVKTLSSLSHDAAALDRFQREVVALSDIEHDNVILATDSGWCGDVPYLVMQYRQGIDAGRLIKAVGTVSIADACEIVRQAAVGLECVHGRGLVHRDLKPSNLLLCDTGCVKILDMGLAKLKEQAADHDLTQNSGLVGTPGYVSPEHVQGRGELQPASDIYSLGCTLYALLTGTPPFAQQHSRSIASQLVAHATQPAPAVRLTRPDVPPELDRLLASMLAKEPGDRPATARQLADSLATWTSGSDLSTIVAEGRSIWNEAESVAADLAQADMAEADISTPKCVEPTIKSDRPRPAPQPAPQSAPNRRPRRWAAAVAAAIAVTLLALAAPWGLGLLSGERAAAKAGGWQELLLTKPTPIVWDTDGGRASWTFNSKRRELHVDATSFAVFAAGETTAESYKLQLGMDQTNWVGGGGLVLGLKGDADAPVVRFQVLYLRFNPNGGLGKELAMHRMLVNFERATGNTLIVRHLVENVRPPRPHEQLLEVWVGPRGMTRVRFDGTDLARLTPAESGEHFSLADHRGGIGIFGDNGSMVFTKLQLLENFDDDGRD